MVRFVTCLTRSSSLCWPGLASLTPLCLEIWGLGGELAQIYFGTLRTEYFSAQTSWGMQICDDPGCRGCSGELPRRERCESRNLGVALLTAANCHIRSVLCLFFFFLLPPTIRSVPLLALRCPTLPTEVAQKTGRAPRGKKSFSRKVGAAFWSDQPSEAASSRRCLLREEESWKARPEGAVQQLPVAVAIYHRVS